MQTLQQQSSTSHTVWKHTPGLDRVTQGNGNNAVAQPLPPWAAAVPPWHMMRPAQWVDKTIISQRCNPPCLLMLHLDHQGMICQ